MTYGKLQTLTGDELDLLTTLNKNLTDGDISRIKDHSYHLDFWFHIRSYELLQKMETPLSAKYDSVVTAGLLSIMRDTLFGFALYITHLKTKKDVTTEQIRALVLIYFSDIVNVHEEYFDEMYEIFLKLLKEFNIFFKDRILFDDNQNFFAFGYKNWVKYTHNKDIENTVTDLT